MAKKRRKSASASESLGRAIALGPVACASILGLALAGIAVSAYLTHAYQQLRSDPDWHTFCAFSARFDCDSVLQSPYSTIGWLPLSTFAVWFYIGIAMVALLMRRWKSVAASRSLATLLFFGSALATIASLILAALSVFAVHSFCVLCVCLYLVNGALLVVSTRLLARTEQRLGSALHVQWRYWTRHPEWLLLPTGGAIFAGLLTIAAFPRPEPPPPLDERCGQLGSEIGDARQLPMSIVVYGDFQCSHCKEVDRLLRRFARDSRLEIAHRQYPLDNQCNAQLKQSFHPSACLLARAAICAGAAGEYDRFAHALYESTPADETSLLGLAVANGLDRAGFASCLTDPATEKKLEDDIRAGVADEVKATPTILFNGRRHVGTFEPSELACLLGERAR